MERFNGHEKKSFFLNKMINMLKTQDSNHFANAYNKLNEPQRQGVDQIEGPVMVVAGPGTGKTQLLGVRIGHILNETDASPHNILCLTFTDAGVLAMRRRLLQFIGPEAYNVNIYTYHAFCNVVIQENISDFGGYRDLQLISDLEQIEVFKDIIDGFGEDHLLKRWKGDVYFERHRLKNLFNTMKQEHWTPKIIKEAVSIHLAKAKNDPDFCYKRKYTDKKTGKVYQKGDFNDKKYATEVKKYEPLLAASQSFETYTKLLKERERFDYHDMILWVIDAFKNKEAMLANYQERYQYFLVDEYQDTNGAQNELLFLLADFWDKPNLFVVGDADQSIYRFQGANMENLLEFRRKFEPQTIVLDRNYRSSQAILDPCIELIKNNEKRLSDKALVESRPDKTIQVAPQISKYYNSVHEDKAIVDKIISLHDDGVAYRDIAIIYRKHKNVADVIKYFELKGVPVNVKKRLDVLHDPEIKRLINIFLYLSKEYDYMHSGDTLIFQILHYEYFDISALDIAKISLYCSTKKDGKYPKWRLVLNNKALLHSLNLQDPEKVFEIAQKLESWIKHMVNITPQNLFEQILTEGNIMDTVMASSEKVMRLQVINTFFEFIKSETDRKKDMTLKDILVMLEDMYANNLPINYNNICFAEDGVHLITAHSSKGLEFEHVFMIRCDEKNWSSGSARNRNFSLPSSLVASADITDREDDRRLFYVAMTRAKNYLYISYPQFTEEEKELEASRFIHEITDVQNLTLSKLGDTEILEFKNELLRFNKGELQLMDHNEIDRVLENFVMSVTNLNKYLRCPISFYFEAILRVPMARKASNGFGSAVHFALEKTFEKLNTNRSLDGLKQDLLNLFALGMDNHHSHFTKREMEDLNIYGAKILSDYYDANAQNWLTAEESEVEYKITLAEHKGIPIKGVLDRVDIFKDRVLVTDYKTGKYNADKMKPPLGDDDNGGDYWRQLVFYKMLMDADPRKNWNMTHGTMDFVEPEKEKWRQKTLEISALDIQLVEEQLAESYDKIKNHAFDEGCGEDFCRWCNFVNETFN